MNRATETLQRVAKLLPEQDRERFYDVMTRFANVPEDDEYLQVLEAIGLLTLLWQKIPGEIEAVLDRTSPALARNGGREVTEQGRVPMVRLWLVSVGLGFGLAALTAFFLHREFEARYRRALDNLESTVAEAGELARALGEPPATSVDFGPVRHDADLRRPVRVVVFEGAVIDAYRDRKGRGVVRLEAADSSEHDRRPATTGTASSRP